MANELSAQRLALGAPGYGGQVLLRQDYGGQGLQIGDEMMTERQSGTQEFKD